MNDFKLFCLVPNKGYSEISLGYRYEPGMLCAQINQFMIRNSISELFYINGKHRLTFVCRKHATHAQANVVSFPAAFKLHLLLTE